MSQKQSQIEKMKIDLKQVLKDHANWTHKDFGTVASFIAGLGENEDGVIEIAHLNQKEGEGEECKTCNFSKVIIDDIQYFKCLNCGDKIPVQATEDSLQAYKKRLVEKVEKKFITFNQPSKFDNREHDGFYNNALSDVLLLINEE